VIAAALVLRAQTAQAEFSISNSKRDEGAYQSARSGTRSFGQCPTTTLKENVMNTKYKYALVMGAGFALGDIAVQDLHAQAKPPAYLIAEVTVNNQDAFMKEFAIPGMKPLQEAGGKFLARGSTPISLEGASPAPRVTVIQFDSMDKA
jgi:hypothetical protein